MTAEIREPPAVLIGTITPKRARPIFRFLPGGKVMPNKATIFGIIRPLPIPYRPLIVYIETKLLENPPHKAQRTYYIQPAENIVL